MFVFVFLSKKVTNHCTISDGNNQLLVKFYPFFLHVPIVRQKLVILEDNFKNEDNLKNEDNFENENAPQNEDKPENIDNS